MTGDKVDWEKVARHLAEDQCRDHRAALKDAFRALAETFRTGDEVTPEDVRELRRILNSARRFVEVTVAPTAGCERWGQPVQSMPAGRAQEVYAPMQAFEGKDE
jgi:hypothetical protein